MKAFLENFAAILGAATVTILALSVSHEYGYFFSVGREFQTFLTTADYLSNGVLWLPVSVLFIYNWVDWWRLKDEDAPAKEAPPKKKTWWDWVSISLGVLIYGAMLALITWPLKFWTAANLLILSVLAWAKIWKRFVPKPEMEEPFKGLIRQAVRVGPPLILGMFFYGSVDAQRDLTRFDQPYGFRFKNENDIQLRVFLRNFDKGVLLRNAVDNKIEFRKWEDIVVVSRPVPSETGTPICWLTGWLCSEQTLPGPL